MVLRNIFKNFQTKKNQVSFCSVCYSYDLSVATIFVLLAVFRQSTAGRKGLVKFEQDLLKIRPTR